MQTLGFNGQQKRSSEISQYTQYLALPSESKDVTIAGRGTFGFRNRYLTKRKVLRTIRRLRRQNT
jgi:hypothetical protein